MKSIICTVARNIWWSRTHRRFFITATKNNFHRLDCFKFIQKMRRNLVERNSKANLDEMVSLYQRFQRGEIDLQDKLESLFLTLPNFSHSCTPVGDPTKFRLLYLHGSPKSVPQPKNELDLLSNEVVTHKQGNRSRRTGLGFLRSSGGLVTGCGSRSYAFYDGLALLESALLRLTLDRMQEAGFQQVVVPDILPTQVIERCGFPTTGERNQIFKIADRKNISDPSAFCLSGTGEMGLAGFCADRVFGGSSGVDAEFFCTVSRCFRHEIAAQESLLYRTHQFNKAEVFCVAKPDAEIADRMFARIVEFQNDLYSSLDLHFRILEMPTSELGDPAHRKVDIEAFMPGEGIFGEISSASNCTDYQSVRLNIRWREGSNTEDCPFAYTLNGTGCAATRILKALVETHQNSDGTVDIPRTLWPYMNGIRKLEADAVPLVAT